jgi:hypothetical protein
VRSLLKALAALPWQAVADHPVATAMTMLKDLYAQDNRRLPVDATIDLGPVWRMLIAGQDRERAFQALEVATLSALRRALRNGSVWIEHSLAFRGREKLFIPENRWKNERRSHYRHLHLPAKAKAFLDPLIERAAAGVAAVAKAAEAGLLTIDEELHLTALTAVEEDPKIAALRTTLDRQVGDAQLPELILAVDAEVRFSMDHAGARAAFSLGAADGVCRHPRPWHIDVGGRDRAHDAETLGRGRAPGHALGGG